MNINNIKWGNIELPGLSDEDLFSKKYSWPLSGLFQLLVTRTKNEQNRNWVAF